MGEDTNSTSHQQSFVADEEWIRLEEGRAEQPNDENHGGCHSKVSDLPRREAGFKRRSSFADVGRD